MDFCRIFSLAPGEALISRQTLPEYLDLRQICHRADFLWRGILSPSPASLSKIFSFLPYTQENGLPALQVRKSHKYWMELGSYGFQILAADMELRLERSLLFECLVFILEFPVGKKFWKFADFLHLGLKIPIKSTQPEKILANVCLICPLNLSSRNPTAFFTVAQMKRRHRGRRKSLPMTLSPRESGRLASCQSEKCWFGLCFSTSWCILNILIE